MEFKDAVLFVPCTEKGRGGGHLSRCARMARHLRQAGLQAFLHVEQPEDIAARYPDLGELLLGEGIDAKTIPWRYIVLDSFQTKPADYGKWAKAAPVICLDEGGDIRNSADIVLDLLPTPPGLSAPNAYEPGLLAVPSKRRSSFGFPPSPHRDAPLRVLISFGAEDAAGLSLPAARSLAALPFCRVFLLGGPLRKTAPEIEFSNLRSLGIELLDPIPDLKEHLADYDMLVTHFGLTALEAAHAQVPVLLVSPSAYHERLARSAGFFSGGLGKGAARRLASIISSKGAPKADVLASIAARSASVAQSLAPSGLESAPGQTHAAGLFKSYTFPTRARCPLCGTPGEAGRKVLARFSDRTYRRCPKCGMVHLIRPNAPPIEYEKDYFFGAYKRQYGKTYLEDFPNLRHMGLRRAERIRSLLPASAPAPRILDIGCAYGPFLDASRSLGFLGFGLDPSEDAVRYVGGELKIPALRGSFPEADLESAFGKELFDAISLWYVIEHMTDVGAALRKVYDLLRPGGVLAFSTPSFAGISARTGERRFLDKSPQDHWTVWDPRITGRLLAGFGFSLKKTVSTGHHPERFPLPGHLIPSQGNGWGYKMLKRVSESGSLGDTFEAYAVKMEDSDRHA